MFKRTRPIQNPCEITFDGQPVTAELGEPLAATLLSAGIEATRTSYVSGQPRAAYCMIGHCFECLVVVDGRANQQACLTPVRTGMVVSTQRGAGT